MYGNGRTLRVRERKLDRVQENDDLGARVCGRGKMEGEKKNRGEENHQNRPTRLPKHKREGGRGNSYWLLNPPWGILVCQKVRKSARIRGLSTISVFFFQKSRKFAAVFKLKTNKQTKNMKNTPQKEKKRPFSSWGFRGACPPGDNAIKKKKKSKEKRIGGCSKFEKEKGAREDGNSKRRLGEERKERVPRQHALGGEGDMKAAAIPPYLLDTNTFPY